MDVGEWLHNLGLGQYKAAFRENDVDAELLPNLAAEDLKELGITSLGHRRRLLEAIAVLRLEGTPADDPARSSTSPTGHPGSPERLKMNRVRPTSGDRAVCASLAIRWDLVFDASAFGHFALSAEGRAAASFVN